MLTRTTALGTWPDQLHVDWVHLEMERDANGPSQTALREPLPEWRAQPVTGISEHTAEVDTSCDLRLHSRGAMFDQHANSFQTCPIVRPAFGRNRRQATVTGTSPRASVSDTNVWQLAVLTSAEAY